MNNFISNGAGALAYLLHLARGRHAVGKAGETGRTGSGRSGDLANGRGSIRAAAAAAAASIRRVEMRANGRSRRTSGHITDPA